MSMRRVDEPSELVRWLQSGTGEEELSGFDLALWPKSIWVLHSMYENPALKGLGTHDEWHKRGLEVGDIAPLNIGDENLDENTILTGTSLGFAVRPGPGWRRITWQEYIDRSGAPGASCGFPPCHGWFPPVSWPLSIEPPPEGSLDEDSLEALLDVLGRGSAEGWETECYAYYAPLTTPDFGSGHLWRGPLRSIPELIAERGGLYPSSPSNFWPMDRSWFVWTDWDLQGTKVSGTHALIESLAASAELDTTSWPFLPSA